MKIINKILNFFRKKEIACKFIVSEKNYDYIDTLAVLRKLIEAEARYRIDKAEKEIAEEKK